MTTTTTDKDKTTTDPPTENKDALPPHLDPSTFPRTVTLPDANVTVELTYNELDTDQLMRRVKSPRAGANVLFLGTTRDTFQSRAVAQLSYTSYAPLALRTMTDIARDAYREHGLVGVSVTHRLGTVPIGEASIAIAVSAPHRGPAWRAAEEILEECKARAEIWKREEYVGERPEDGVWKRNCEWDAEGRRRDVSLNQPLNRTD